MHRAMRDLMTRQASLASVSSSLGADWFKRLLQAIQQVLSAEDKRYNAIGKGCGMRGAHFWQAMSGHKQEEYSDPKAKGRTYGLFAKP